MMLVACRRPCVPLSTRSAKVDRARKRLHVWALPQQVQPDCRYLTKNLTRRASVPPNTYHARLVPEHVDLTKRLTHTCTDVMVMITHERPYRQHPKRLCPADLRRTASCTHLSTTGSCMHMITPYLAFEQMPDFTSAAMIVRKSALTSFTSQAYLS